MRTHDLGQALACLTYIPTLRFYTMLRRLILICGTVEKVSALVHSPPLEGWQAKPDGVVVVVLHNVTPLDFDIWDC